MEFGKKLMAKEFAKHILCKNKEDFTSVENGNHPDFSIIEPDGGTIKIEQIRLMQEKILEKPIKSNRKVYIINDSQTMIKEAQNCLLKTLEEPPQYATIILICSNENMLLNTILSRCTKMSFKGIGNNILKKYILDNNIIQDVSDSMLNTLNGSIGKAYEFKEKKELYEEIRPVFENIYKYDKIDIVKKSESLYKAKENIIDCLEYGTLILFEQSKKDNRYLNCIKYIELAKNKLKQNSNFDMTIDNLLFHLWEEIHEDDNRS